MNEFTEQAIASLKRSGNTEVRHVSHFSVARTDKRGHDDALDIEISDRGPDASPRYHVCAVRAKDGRRAAGAANDDLQTAIGQVAWGEFDW
jgi:hypothetical protein